ASRLSFEFFSLQFIQHLRRGATVQRGLLQPFCKAWRQFSYYVLAPVIVTRLSFARLKWQRQPWIAQALARDGVNGQRGYVNGSRSILQPVRGNSSDIFNHWHEVPYAVVLGSYRQCGQFKFCLSRKRVTPIAFHPPVSSQSHHLGSLAHRRSRPDSEWHRQVFGFGLFFDLGG